ncbi:hypothetical protein [Deinococcus roseus]|uniref:ABC transporter permease n=1 Tax=Deinococcus roseus TaxID=392414 RepID=A0ABQ2D2G7_9DEIO|nr:hypothetical protein [Deinococcus roseus]GGJ37308.1 hypothetical protein GCM10008938_24250 [Deinococcus roseus]
MLQGFRIAGFKVRADFKEQRRYPLQMVFGLITTGIVLWGLGLGAAKTSGNAAFLATLSTFIATAGVTVFYMIPRALGSGDDHPPEEIMLFPYKLGSLLLTLSLTLGAQLALGFGGMYVLMAWATQNLHFPIELIFAALGLAAVSVLGLGMLMFALKMVLRKVQNISTLVQLGLFAVAFAPVQNLGSWVDVLPLVGVIHWLHQPSWIGAGWITFYGLVWLLIGLLAVQIAEHTVMKRGIAAHA